jgi:acetyl esterase/lipase
MYLGDLDHRNPIVSPIYADFLGLPQVLVHIGDDEILLDDSARLVERARGAGVEVNLQNLYGLWPVFHQVDMPEAAQATGEIGEVVKKKVGARVG